jgi:dynactin complex subunit
MTKVIIPTEWFIKWTKMETLKNAQIFKIEIVAISIWLSLFINNTGKFKPSYTPYSTGLKGNSTFICGIRTFLIYKQFGSYNYIVF